MLFKAEPVRVSPCRPRGIQGEMGAKKGKAGKRKTEKKKGRKRNGKMTGG
jgi:hypothetical protein